MVTCPRGGNQGGMRQFNERVALQALRLHGALAKADNARLTRLTPPSVQVILARLEADELVRHLVPVRSLTRPYRLWPPSRPSQPRLPRPSTPQRAASVRRQQYPPSRGAAPRGAGNRRADSTP